MIVEKIPIHTDHTQVELITYFQENSPEMGADRKRPVVLICPGGGYHFRSDREAEPVALRMCGMGFHACVLCSASRRKPFRPHCGSWRRR